MTTLLAYARYPLYIFTSLFTLCSGALYWKQNEIIYPRFMPPGCREPAGVPTPDQFGISDWSSPTLITPDGERLHTFLVQPPRTHPNYGNGRGRVQEEGEKDGGAEGRGGRGGLVVIMFHGNAGNIGHRLPIAKIIAEQAGVRVFLVEYRGYGLSTGQPDEEGLVRDAQTALDWVRQSEECRGDGVVVYGQSIGGAVAVRVVVTNQPNRFGGRGNGGGGDSESEEEGEGGEIRGLMLENTLTSMRKLIPREKRVDGRAEEKTALTRSSALPPAKYLAPLCHQTWKSEEYIPKIRNVPILFLSGLKDEIIP
ncbi:uncharacterized protein KY384_008900 [Bacidia gigantensis]|uniref:uncharacterized protein n=1 Tax=Bacidia gigantensis TaxID=2732470 RepID=UPI001D037EBF|nr:uncharacterized protein KY384_008900 [Bacidia gigantensis]KAG8525256.1 hypothetical protein KY384_008900 [Bacidia gigantensis]